MILKTNLTLSFNYNSKNGIKDNFSYVFLTTCTSLLNLIEFGE